MTYETLSSSSSPFPSAAACAAIEALADPTRRAIIAALKDQPQAVGALAEPLPVSRPAVSQHLKVLTDAGLVEATPQGNRRIYSLSHAGVIELRGYLDSLWDEALTAFVAEANRVKKGNTQ